MGEWGVGQMQRLQGAAGVKLLFAYKKFGAGALWRRRPRVVPSYGVGFTGSLHDEVEELGGGEHAEDNGKASALDTRK